MDSAPQASMRLPLSESALSHRRGDTVFPRTHPPFPRGFSPAPLVSAASPSRRPPLQRYTPRLASCREEKRLRGVHLVWGPNVLGRGTRRAPSRSFTSPPLIISSSPPPSSSPLPSVLGRCLFSGPPSSSLRLQHHPPMPCWLKICLSSRFLPRPTPSLVLQRTPVRTGASACMARGCLSCHVPARLVGCLCGRRA